MKKRSRGLSKRIELRVSDSDYILIKQKARAENKNVSMYVRSRILAEEIKVASERADLAKEINKIGTNINQIARFFNSGFLYPKAREELLVEITKVYDLLERRL